MMKLKLLIIDDEPAILKGVFRALKNYTFNVQDFKDVVGFDITQASTGNDALSLLEKNAFDLVLLDYKLPDITGIDILNIIKEKQYPLLTIIMTAYASLDVAISTIKHGAFDFIAKPFAPEELRNIVRKVATNIIFYKKARKLEEEKKQIRFEFLSILSHELKAPINAIEGYLNIMDSKIAGNDIDSYENMIKRSLIRISTMRKLILDLLDLTRIESRQKSRDFDKNNILELVNSSLDTYSASVKDKNISISVDIPDELYFYSDKSELEIIFNNLISNAVKYNKENGKIDLLISGNPEEIDIRISDTGIGLKPEEKERLFGEFVRIRNDYTKNIEGSGLGLSILKKLVALYDGSIEIESEFNVGTALNIKLKAPSSRCAHDCGEKLPPDTPGGPNDK